MCMAFRKFSAFNKWIKSAASRNIKYYSRLISDGTVLIVSDEKYLNEVTPEGHDWPFTGALQEIEIPSTETAKQWWESMILNGTFTYKICDKELPLSVICIAKVGVWAEIPQMWLEVSKDEFRDISEHEFLSSVGKELEREMLIETLYVGISVRRLKVKFKGKRA